MGAGMSQNSSLYNFRASQNKLQASTELSTLLAFQAGIWRHAQQAVRQAQP